MPRPLKEVLPNVKYGSPDKPLKIGEFELPCYVLSDDRRVLTQRGLANALGISSGGGRAGVHRIAQFINSEQLKPLITKDLRARIEQPIKFQSLTSISNGYEATILVDICDAVIEARKIGVLQKQQKHIVERAEQLIRAFAKTGIIALIDEVTGYGEFREKDALQQFLTKFIKEERGVYVKTYPDDFFQAIFKMKNLTWSLANKGRKPQYIGHYINNYVYSRIAPDVLNVLRTINPKDESGKRKSKHTQHIHVDYGHPKLKEHLSILTAFAKAVGYNWGNWERMVNRALPRFESDGSAMQELDFKDID